MEPIKCKKSNFRVGDIYYRLTEDPNFKYLFKISGKPNRDRIMPKVSEFKIGDQIKFGNNITYEIIASPATREDYKKYMTCKYLNNTAIVKYKDYDDNLNYYCWCSLDDSVTLVEKPISTNRINQIEIY